MSKRKKKREKILLVEDDHGVAFLTRENLEEEGFEVDLAYDGSQGLEKLNQNSYDAILLDHRLPDMNGIEMMKEIQRRGIEIPQIIVTGAGDERIAVKAMKSGAYDYVVKTGDLSYLVALPITIRMSLERYNLAKEKEGLERQLKDYTLLLERKVEERTKELLELNENLEQLVREKTKELKETQAQLVQAGKLAALGTLGAGVAHELNNPLTVVSAEADEILDAVNHGYLDQNLVVVSAQNIKSHAERMRVIIDHIRQFARDDKNSEWKKISINDPIRDSLILLRTQLESLGIEILLELDENLPKIWGHHNKLESIFQNLITNARDAFKNIKDRRHKTIKIRSYQKDRDKIVVEVADNACGIPKDVLPNIFNPFFTTKDVGSGTGLGLSITHSNVKEHGGEISVISKAGEGTTFILTFPLERRKKLKTSNE
ncbi:MAG: response regulator [Calditrichaeota bacterium]|nr:MAG: response regulator [Calditrichota bacterium]